MKLTVTVAIGKQALEKTDTLERFHFVSFFPTTIHTPQRGADPTSKYEAVADGK